MNSGVGSTGSVDRGSRMTVPCRVHWSSQLSSAFFSGFFLELRVPAHPQIDVLGVHPAARPALVFMNEVLVEEGNIDDLAPGSVQVDGLGESDRVGIGAHAPRLLMDAGMGDIGARW